MPVLYEDTFFVVKQSWFGPWRVVDKSTGATIAPELILQEKLGLTWPLIRRNRLLPKDFCRYAEGVLMQTFAKAALRPSEELGLLFAKSSPGALAAGMIAEAETRLASLLEPPPPLPPRHPWLDARHIVVNGDLHLWFDDATGRIWAGYSHIPDAYPADPEDVTRYWAIHDAILESPVFRGRSNAALDAFHPIFARSVLNHFREREFVRDWPIPHILVRLRTLVIEAEK